MRDEGGGEVKVFYIPAAVLLLILGFSLWTGYYVEGCMEQWDTILEEADKAVRQEDWAAAKEAIDRAHADWDECQTFLHVIMEHEELDKAEELFAGAFVMCEEAEGPGLRSLLAQLMSQMDALSETQSLGIKNIM